MLSSLLTYLPDIHEQELLDFHEVSYFSLAYIFCSYMLNMHEQELQIHEVLLYFNMFMRNSAFGLVFSSAPGSTGVSLHIFMEVLMNIL